MSTMLRFLLLWFLVFGLAAAQRPTVTSTYTTIETTTTTSTVSTSSVCVSYISATSTCRRKREVWLNLHKILSKDHDNFHHLEDQFIAPSAVEQVQQTELPYIQPYYGQRHGYQHYPDKPVDYLQSSRFHQLPLVGYNRGFFGQFRVPEPQPILFAQAAALATFLGDLFYLPSTTTVVATSITTVTATSYTTTTTIPMTISGCVVPAITYKNC